MRLALCYWSGENFDRSRGPTLSKWRIFSLSDEHYFIVIPLNVDEWTRILNTFRVPSSSCNVKSADSVRLHATQEKPSFHSKAAKLMMNHCLINSSCWTQRIWLPFLHVFSTIRTLFYGTFRFEFSSLAHSLAQCVQTDKMLTYANMYWTLN